jgi:hypothetical protein
MRPPLNESERARLGVVAEALISGGAGMPSAKDANVQGVWIDRVLADRPDLLEPIKMAASTSGDPLLTLDRLGSQNPEALNLLRFAIVAAYLINPRVRALLGYPGGVPERQPAYPDEADSYLEDGILDPVIQRGAIFRATPMESE